MVPVIQVAITTMATTREAIPTREATGTREAMGTRETSTVSTSVKHPMFAFIANNAQECHCQAASSKPLADVTQKFMHQH